MRASVAIIGGGVQGLMLAWCLAERGLKDVQVFDAGYWQGGASGRNGTMVRGGFSSPEWTRFFGYSHRLWLGLSRRLGHNVMFTRRGYAILAEADGAASVLERSLAVNRACGVVSRPLPADELRARLPLVRHERVKAAMIFDDGGVAPHHAFMKALLAACAEKRIAVSYGTEVTAIERRGDRAAGVWLGDRLVAADAVVIAAGGHSSEVAQLAGVALDGRPWRIEACAIEPLRATLGPALALLDRTVYMQQTGRGEIVGGCEPAGEHRGLTLASDVPVMAHYARHLVEMMPVLARLRILRQWAGIIHASPDFAPLLGPHPDLRDLWISAGWSYGIMGAPAAGDLLAKAIVTGTIDDRMAPFAVDRRRRNRLIAEGAIVLPD